MKLSKVLILGLGVSLSSVSFANSAEVVEARALAKQFVGQLKPALGAAMKEGGPVHAISVCKDKAPAIAQKLSKSSGWDVKRVSLKNRSPIAEPDAWETKVLNQFEQQRADGMKPAKIEYSEVVQENGQKTFRYMKAIGIGKGQPCLHCHGTNLSDGVKQKLQELYPNDKATGYTVGQIRGAFSFKKAL